MDAKDFVSFWNEVHTIIDDAMRARDRSVSVYFHPETDFSVNVYPWPDEESLREAYTQGKISYNDYRVKIGLGMVRP